MMLCRSGSQTGDRDCLARVRSWSVLGMVGVIFISRNVKVSRERRPERHVGMGGCAVLQKLEARCAD